MPVELRKRKAPQEPVPPPPTKKSNGKAGKVTKTVDKVKKAVTEKKTEPVKEDTKPAEPAPAPVVEEAAPPATSEATTEKKSGQPASVGSTIDLDTFGGEIEKNDGTKTTLKKLVEESKAGVVLFTYPKASTPGCTTQVCLFRDSYEPLTADGLAVYGLSNDSPKSNTTFKEKQKLPYSLLCDPQRTLISAIGMKKTPSGTQRGVFVVDKAGKVLVMEPGGPAATADRVKKLVKEMKG